MEQSQRVDVTLYGDSLQSWREWVKTLEGQEWLLRWAIRANKAVVMFSLPLWMIASILSVLLTPLVILASGLLFWPFHLLMIRPLTFLVIWSSELWMVIPFVRPVLLLIGPILAAFTLIAVHLVPDMNVDYKEARQVLCELWPLSRRRLNWIAEHGTGRAQLAAG